MAAAAESSGGAPPRPGFRYSSDNNDRVARRSTSCARWPSASTAPSPDATAFLPYGRQEISDEDVDGRRRGAARAAHHPGPDDRPLRARRSPTTSAPATRSPSRAARRRCTARPSPPGSGQATRLITSPITFAASANCALYLGARPALRRHRPGHLEPRRGGRGRSAAGRDTKAVVAGQLRRPPRRPRAARRRVRDRVVGDRGRLPRARRPIATERRWAAPAAPT